MNEETLNLGVRRFLKQFGVTAQRQIEHAVREAAAAGTLPETPLLARAVLAVDGMGEIAAVSGEIPTR